MRLQPSLKHYMIYNSNENKVKLFAMLLHNKYLLRLQLPLPASMG